MTTALLALAVMSLHIGRLMTARAVAFTTIAMCAAAIGLTVFGGAL